jgi:hypothetical protein
MNVPQSFGQQLDSIFLHKTKIQIDCRHWTAMNRSIILQLVMIEPSATSSEICKSGKPIYGRTSAWNQADFLPPTHFYYEDAKTKTHFMEY